MAGPFRVLTTPAFEREFRAISKKDSSARSRPRRTDFDSRRRSPQPQRTTPGQKARRSEAWRRTMARALERLPASLRYFRKRSRAAFLPASEGCVLTADYFPASSFFTASLTTLPSTRRPAAAKRAMAAFITVPMSFMVSGPVISMMAARTPATISSSPAAFGR